MMFVIDFCPLADGLAKLFRLAWFARCASSPSLVAAAFIQSQYNSSFAFTNADVAEMACSSASRTTLRNTRQDVQASSC